MALQCYTQCLEVSPNNERAQDGLEQVNQFIQDDLGLESFHDIDVNIV